MEKNIHTIDFEFTDSTQSEFTPVGKEGLNGKKIIFFGNSFTYYGKCVIGKGQNVYSQDKRINDKGYFYQICKSNGIDINVCNFTFGGHQLKDFYSGSCAANRGHNGLDHLAYINDYNYDYVVMQNGAASMNLESILAECQPIMDRFKKANPNVKFIFLVQYRAHQKGYVWLSDIKNLEKSGILVVDWGRLVCDIIDGNVKVPGATQEYNFNSFVISQSKTDGFHQNMLAGYITALMTYCALTGESAQGQQVSFENVKALNSSGIKAYRAKYYTYKTETNFDTILASKSDMAGIQQLIDRYIEAKAYRNY